MKCGLLGRKLGHSYSPRIHSFLGNYPYVLYEVEPDNLEQFLRCGNFHGLNVTMPYKKDVIPYLDELSPVAQQLGAVNTIVRRPDGTLIGHNTDHFGFQTMMNASNTDVSGKKCLVLGSGGASNTAVHVLRQSGAVVAVISRSGADNYSNLDKHRDASLIVNATPVGMYPHTGISAVDLKEFPKLECVLDLVYNPARTQLLLDAESLGIPGYNGLLMLVAQAKEAAEWFTGQAIHDHRIHEVHHILRTQMENIILIGMPGCGKSTLGRLLSEKLGREFADTDHYIEARAGKPIPEIFAQDGERTFRDLETQVLEELGKRSGLVIATGGGCVTRAENYPLLHQNGTIFWLTRELEKLPTQGRPLSQAHKLDDLYTRRRSLYDHFADCVVDNNGFPESAFDQITGVLEVMK